MVVAAEKREVPPTSAPFIAANTASAANPNIILAPTNSVSPVNAVANTADTAANAAANTVISLGDTAFANAAHTTSEVVANTAANSAFSVAACTSDVMKSVAAYIQHTKRVIATEYCLCDRLWSFSFKESESFIFSRVCEGAD